MKKINLAFVVVTALGALALNSCETATGTGALVGAATGAAIGSAAGGHHGYYPYGRRTDTPGLLRSPYPPHSLVDVRGVPRGALVQDPTTGRIFRRP